jgi:hypothetical protein
MNAMSLSRWIAAAAVFAGCTSSGAGGSESNFLKCTTTSDCAPGFVCASGTCEAYDASGVSGAGGIAGDGGAGAIAGGRAGTGGNVGRGGAGLASSGGQSAGRGGTVPSDAGHERGVGGRDGGSDPDGSLDYAFGATVACFDVPASACGAIARWMPVAANSPWEVYRAVPIEGDDGFVALLSRGPIVSSDAFVFATVPTNGGCAKAASPPWTNVVKFAGASRAVSRGGTLAIVGKCVQRFVCGATLILNGKEWADPLGMPSSIEIDVASDGRTLLVSSDYGAGEAGAAQQIVERWLSPAGSVLAERRYDGIRVLDVSIVDDGAIALALSTADGASSYVQFQSAAFENVARWNAAQGQTITAIGLHVPWLAVTGFDASTPYGWTSLLSVQSHTDLWGRVHTDTGFPVAVETNADGSVNTTVFEAPSTPSHLLLRETQTVAGTRTASFDPMYVPSGPVRIPPFGGMQTRSGGRISFSTDFAGTYCEDD